ncbi:hypothetical protein H4J51_10385 [Colwellia sp. MB02u-18]|uniref:hypothetical protein n=1 Tax=unclassified Colwellia TaxID=196834 RepID=UPI0015F3FFFA|nr:MULTISPECIES: hypothetical protein [unclassified Colwellia]MBA6225589.1 hypothetical protein [Colwellia sp. MB3u-45]MBA6266731.1 hypothetical protein [Colwellia sp. MB3u-43]MBA6321749.1 hypothetical protein [Colwellia sp. MB02u-19]MBA6324979.1 hypothetical protein [Colwellia sp. MB02u-18]MBA6331344.1 hypothetical protein [Colwellia sp. MB02u-12]
MDKNAGDHYTFHNIRPEIEYGVTEKLTMAAKAIISVHNYDVGSEAEGAPINFLSLGY